MKKMHLLCNAHLDPAWLWRWNEGLAEAISTFRVAADFCEEYDSFIFNHNEALLYEWVEEHEPQLFERIKKLVSKGKWHIIGGWYLQPDCVMTSGESLIEQINLGREYFKEKFGVVPETAMNIDSFGHTQGLVQILNKKGFKNYIVMRPGGRFRVKEDGFWWQGYDGSKILTHSIYDGYSSSKGEAVFKVKRNINQHKDSKEVFLLYWGVGNHGGGPSRKDIEEINEFANRYEEVEIIHSTAPAYFADINTSNLPTVNEPLIAWAVGCYTSMIRIKQANRRLENKIALTEKAMSYAKATKNAEFNYAELKKAKKALAFCQFHDILPGSGIKAVEDDALKDLGYGEKITDQLFTKAFFKLCEGQVKAKDGEIPIMVFNPHPYVVEGEFEVGFILQNQNWNDNEITLAEVYDENGNLLPTQNEKSECTFNLDWPKKVAFRAKLAPFAMSRFDCRLKVHKIDELPVNDYAKGDVFAVENDRMRVHISRKTGLIELYEVDGKALIKNSGILEVYKDNEDPWGMTVNKFIDFEDSFRLLSREEANEIVGYPDEDTENVRIVEDGDVRTIIQAFFGYKKNFAIVEYTIPKNDIYFDVNIIMNSNEPNKMLKYHLNSEIKGKPYGQTAFGSEPLYDNEDESVYHKWCGIKADDNQLYVINDCVYGGSFNESTIKLSLLRTPIYSAHPIMERPIAPHNRYLKHIDMGERTYSFRITNEKNIDKAAQIFNEKPQVMSFFPSGEGEKADNFIKIDNDKILLSSVRNNDDGYELTLYNTVQTEENAVVEIPCLNKKIELKFGKMELKFIEV